MIIDNQIEGFTCDITSNFLDIYLDENNNSFSNIDNRSQAANSTTFNLPQSAFSFKSNFMQSIDFNKSTKLDENDDLNADLKMKLNKQITKQSVKRALFVEKDEIDHEANLKLVRKQMEQLERQDCERWNFDFKNNCPLNGLNSRYEWFTGELVLNKLDLNAPTPSNSVQVSVNKTNCNTSCNNANKLGNISNSDKKFDNELALPSAHHIATRSLKRKLNINDYFQPAKKRGQNCIPKDQSKASDVLLPVNTSNVKSTVKYQKDQQIKDAVRSIKFQQAQSIKPTLKRKCKKARSSSTQPPRQKKSKSLAKQVTKRQTTLKF